MKIAMIEFEKFCDKYERMCNENFFSDESPYILGGFFPLLYLSHRNIASHPLKCTDCIKLNEKKDSNGVFLDCKCREEDGCFGLNANCVKKHHINYEL